MALIALHRLTTRRRMTAPWEHVTFADESERVEDMAIECPVSP
jgi:hypothetical protein